MNVKLTPLLVDRGTCMYLPDRQARLLVQAVQIPVGRALDANLNPAMVLSPQDVETMLSRGYSRQGYEFWTQSCRDCRECIPMRIPVRSFVPSRSQKRTWKRNLDLRVEFSPANLTDEKYDLICYHRRKFGYPDSLPRKNYEMTWSQLGTRAFEILYYRRDGALLGLGLVEPTPNALSSMEFFHVVDRRRNLGTFSLLFEIEWTRTTGREYLYLGPYVRDCTYMAYKAAFRPFEMLIGDRWVLNEPGADRSGSCAAPGDPAGSGPPDPAAPSFPGPTASPS